jgi:hypothetical protein
MPAKIEFDNLGIGEALVRDRLAVPLHQRDYAWEDKQVEDLFQDLASAIDDGKGAYYLGTISLTRSDDGVFQVVDGQQRLATTTILLGAIRDYLLSLNDDARVTVAETFLSTIVIETGETVPRLTLNVDDNDFFHKRIICRPNDKKRKTAKPRSPSHRLIEAAARMAEQFVENVVKPFNAKNRIDCLARWVRFVEKSVMVIRAISVDDVDAFILFETQNDRGLRTTQADLAKNYLFAAAGDRIIEAQQRWTSMRGALETIGEDVTLTYLRHLSISRFGYTREREVLQRIREKVKSRVHAIDFLETLAKSAHEYVAIQSPEHSRWNQNAPSIREHIKTLGMLGVTPLRPLILAVASDFSKHRVEVTFRLFVSWAVRLLIYGGGRSGTVEHAIADAAMGVSSGTIKTVAALAKTMDSAIPGDAAFQAAFANVKVKTSKFARYYLRALELKKQGRPEPEWIPNDDPVINLEHILPNNPVNGWDHFDSETAPAYCERLGNMVLLQATKNAIAGNSSFASKRKHYAESSFILTKEVADHKQWGPTEIDERQKRLASIAVKTWPIDKLD